MKLTGEQVITAALVRGVAFFREDDISYAGNSYDPIPDTGWAWLNLHKADIHKALAPENSYRLESCIKAGLGGVWLEAHRRALAKLTEDNPTWTAQRLNMVAWAQVLGAGRPIPWPELEEAEEAKKGPVRPQETPQPQEKPRPQERHTGQLFKDDRRWTA